MTACTTASPKHSQPFFVHATRCIEYVTPRFFMSVQFLRAYTLHRIGALGFCGYKGALTAGVSRPHSWPGFSVSSTRGSSVPVALSGSGFYGSFATCVATGHNVL